MMIWVQPLPPQVLFNKEMQLYRYWLISKYNKKIFPKYPSMVVFVLSLATAKAKCLKNSFFSKEDVSRPQILLDPGNEILHVGVHSGSSSIADAGPERDDSEEVHCRSWNFSAAIPGNKRPSRIPFARIFS